MATNRGIGKVFIDYNEITEISLFWFDVNETLFRTTTQQKSLRVGLHHQMS